MDLKNPLQAIIGGAKLMSRIPPEKQASIVEMILMAGERAHDLIKTYLDAAEAESGQAMKVDWSVLDPGPLVEDELRLLQSSLSERLAKVALVNQVECGPIRADGRKLRQILANLLSNAIKYSPDGGQILIRGQRRGDEARPADEPSTGSSPRPLRAEAYFEVQDQGIGISDQDQKRLFGAFQRVGDTSVAPGSGLGLCGAGPGSRGTHRPRQPARPGLDFLVQPSPGVIAPAACA